MKNNTLEQQNYKKRKKSSEKLKETPLSLSQRPTLCWSKLNRNPENIVPRFPKLQQRSSKLRVKGMTTILEESLAVLNTPKIPSNSSLTNSNVSNTITDPSATSNDVDSLTLASANEFVPYAQNFTVFPLSVPFSHLFLGNKKSTGSIKKSNRRKRSNSSISDSSTSVSIMERRPSILQCILSEVFSNGKDEKVEVTARKIDDIKTKKNDEKKDKDVVKHENKNVLKTQCENSKRISKNEKFDEKEEEEKMEREIEKGNEQKVEQKRVSVEGADIGKFKDTERKKEVYENDMGRVEEEMRRREYEQIYRMSRERESREKRPSREIDRKLMEKYKNTRGRSKESRKSNRKESRNRSKQAEKVSRDTERRSSVNRHKDNLEDKEKNNKKRLKLFQRKTKHSASPKKDNEGEENMLNEKKKIIFSNSSNDFDRKQDINNVNDKEEDKAECKRKIDKDIRRSTVIEDSNRRSSKNRYSKLETEECRDEIHLRNKSKNKVERKNDKVKIDFELKEEDKKKTLIAPKTEKNAIEDERKSDKKHSRENKKDRVNKEKTAKEYENKQEAKNGKKDEVKEKSYSKVQIKGKSFDKIKGESKINKDAEKRERCKENKIREKGKIESNLQKESNKPAEENIKDFKFSDEMKNMMNKDIRGKRYNKSPKRLLFIGDAGEGVLDHKAPVSSHKPVEASRSEDTPSYDRDNSFIKIKKSLKQFAEYSKHKLEDKISSFSVNTNRNIYDSSSNTRKRRFSRNRDKLNITISKTSNMQQVLQQDEACYKNLYSCETHQISKPKPTIRLEDLGSLEIPAYKPKSPSKITSDIQDDPSSGISVISPYESTGCNSSMIASTSLMIISDFSETEHSNASTKLSFRDVIEELCTKPTFERFPNFPINPYCLMAFNNYKRKNINRGTNTEITWTRDELKFNINSARAISKAKIKVPQYQIRKAMLKNKTVKERNKFPPEDLKSSRIPIKTRDASPSSEASSKAEEKNLSRIPRRNPAVRSVSSPNNDIKFRNEIMNKIEAIEVKVTQTVEEKVRNQSSNVEEKKKSLENKLQQSQQTIISEQSKSQDQKLDSVTQTSNNKNLENRSSSLEETNLIESITALDHIRNIEEEIYDFSDETEEFSKKKKHKKTRWYSNLFSRSFGDGKRISEEMIDRVTEDVSDRKRFNSKISRPKPVRNFREESTKIVEEDFEIENNEVETKDVEQNAGGNLESLAAALKEKTRLSFEAELRKIEEDFLKYKNEKTKILDNEVIKSDLNIIGESLKSEEFIKKESLEVSSVIDDMPQPAFREQSGTIMSPKVPPRTPKIVNSTESSKATYTKQILPSYPTQIPRKLPPLPPKDFPECPNFINNESLLVNMMNEKTISLLPSSVKLTSSVSLISIKEVNSKTHSVSLQVMMPSKAVETNTSKSLIVGKSTKKSKLPLRVKSKNEKKRVNSTNSFTFPIEIDLKKAMAEAKSTGNVSGFYEAPDYFSPTGQDLNFSSSNTVTSKFGSYLKKIKKFFVGEPDNLKVDIELKISAYESVCTILDERLRLKQMSSSESDLISDHNYFKQPIVAALATAVPAADKPSQPTKQFLDKYNGPIPIDIEGFLYFIFTSLLRKYLEEEIALKALVPCSMGQQYKAPKLPDSILVNPDPILNKVSSIECKYDKDEMRKPGFVKNITITVEDIERDENMKKLPPNLKRLKDIKIKNDYVFEIVYDDEIIAQMEDKDVQTDFEEEEIYEEVEEEEEIRTSDKEIQTDIEEEDDLVEIISIAVQTDDEDGAEVTSISIQTEDGENKEYEFGDGDGSNVGEKDKKVEHASEDESEYEETTEEKPNESASSEDIKNKIPKKGSNDILPKYMKESKDMKEESFDPVPKGKNIIVKKSDGSEYEETTESSGGLPKSNKDDLDPNYLKDKMSRKSEEKSTSIADSSESITVESISIQTDKIDEETRSIENFQKPDDAVKIETEESLEEIWKKKDDTDISNDAKSLDSDVISEPQKSHKPLVRKDSSVIRIGATLSEEEFKSDVKLQSSTDTILSKKKSDRSKFKLKRKYNIQKPDWSKIKLKGKYSTKKKAIEDASEPCVCSNKVNQSEIPSLPMRPTRSDDFTLVLEPTQGDVELIIGFKDNDFKLIFPSKGSNISIASEEQSDFIYDLLNVLFENLKENKEFVRKMHKVLQNANKDIAKKLFNSKSIARAKAFIKDILNSVIEREGVWILDAKKIMQIEKKYRDLCRVCGTICECAELKKTSYNNILTIDNSNLKRCVCGDLKNHTKSCPSIPKENLRKKHKRVRKNGNEFNRFDFTVLHTFEQQPPSDELKKDEEKKVKEKNEVELERSYNSIVEDLSKGSFELKPFVPPVNVFRLKEEEFSKNPPILWSLAKKFLRNRRNRTEERKRLAARRRCDSEQNVRKEKKKGRNECLKRNSNSSRYSSSSSRICTHSPYQTSTSQGSANSFLYSQSEFLKTCSNISSFNDVLLRKLDSENEICLEKRLEYLYPKNAQVRRRCPDSSKCVSSSNSSGYALSVTQIETALKEDRNKKKTSDVNKKERMDASTSDNNVNLENDSEIVLKKQDFKYKEGTKSKKMEEVKKEDKEIVTDEKQEVSGDPSNTPFLGYVSEKESISKKRNSLKGGKKKKNKEKRSSSTSSGENTIKNREQVVEGEIETYHDTALQAEPDTPKASITPTKNEGEPYRNSVTAEIGTNTTHIPKKIKRRKQKSSKETETQTDCRKTVEMEVIAEEEEPKEEIEIIDVRKPDDKEKESCIIKKRCTLCEELDNENREKKKLKKKKKKKPDDFNPNTEDNILTYKQPEESDFQEEVPIEEPEVNVEEQFKEESKAPADIQRPTLCDTLKNLTPKKDCKCSDGKNDKPLVLLTSDMPLDKIDKLLSKILTPKGKSDLAKRMVPSSSESSIPQSSNTNESVKKTNSVPEINVEKDKKIDIVKYINESKDAILARLSKTDQHKKTFLEDNILKYLFQWKKSKPSPEVSPNIVSCSCKNDTSKTNISVSPGQNSNENKKMYKNLQTAVPKTAVPLSDSDKSDNIPLAPTNSPSNLGVKQSVLKDPSLIDKLKPLYVDVPKSDIYTETENLGENQALVEDQENENKRKSYVSTGSDPIYIKEETLVSTKTSIISVQSPELDDLPEKEQEENEFPLITANHRTKSRIHISVSSSKRELEGETEQNNMNIKAEEEQLTDSKESEKENSERTTNVDEEDIKKDDIQTIYSAYESEARNSSDESKKSKRKSKRSSEISKKKRNSSKSFEVLDSPTQTSVESEIKDEIGIQTSINNSIKATTAEVVSAGINTNHSVIAPTTELTNTKIQTSKSLLPVCPGKERTLRNLSSENPEESLYVLRKVKGPSKPKKEPNQFGNIFGWPFFKNKIKPPAEEKTLPKKIDNTVKNRTTNTKNVPHIKPIQNCNNNSNLITKKVCNQCTSTYKSKDKRNEKVTYKQTKDEDTKYQDVSKKDANIQHDDEDISKKTKSKTEDNVGEGDKNYIRIPIPRDEKRNSSISSNEDFKIKKLIEDKSDTNMYNRNKLKSDPRTYPSPDKTEAKQQTDPDPYGPQLIEVRKNDPDRNIYDTVHDPNRNIYDSDPKYDMTIARRKDKSIDVNYSNEEIKQAPLKYSDDIFIMQPEKPKTKYQSIGIQVNVVENQNCKCPGKICSSPLQKPMKVDKRYSDTDSDRTLVSPIEPKRNTNGVKPKETNGIYKTGRNSSLSKVNETEIGVVDFEKYCLCKSNNKLLQDPNTLKYPNPSKAVSLKRIPDIIPHEPKVKKNVNKHSDINKTGKENKLIKGLKNLMSMMYPSDICNNKHLGLSPENICRGQGNADDRVIERNRERSILCNKLDPSSKDNFVIYKNNSFKNTEVDDVGTEPLTKQTNYQHLKSTNDKDHEKSNSTDSEGTYFTNIKDSITVTVDNQRISKSNKYSDGHLYNKNNEENVMYNYEVRKATNKDPPFSYDIVKYFNDEDKSHNSELEDIFEEELELIKEIQKRALYSDKKYTLHKQNILSQDDNPVNDDLNSDDLIHVVGKDFKKKPLIKVDVNDTPSTINRKLRGYKIAEDLDFNDSEYDFDVMKERIIRKEAMALAEILDFDEEEFNLEAALRHKSKNKIDQHRGRLKVPKKYFKKMSLLSNEKHSMSSKYKSNSNDIGEWNESKITEIDIFPDENRETSVKTEGEEKYHTEVKEEEHTEAENKCLDKDPEGKEKCGCCVDCDEFIHSCRNPDSTYVCNISNPNVCLTSYKEFLSIVPQEKQLKTETILNFDSEGSKGEEDTKLSLLKDLLESNLVLSNKKSFNKVSDIKVEIDEDVCVLNEDSIPQKSSTKNSARLSTIIEKSENETTQKKPLTFNVQKPLTTKLEINDTEVVKTNMKIVKTNMSGHDKDVENIKPRLIGLSKFLKKISKAVHRKKVHDKLSISTIFAPRNLIDSCSPPVAEIEIGGKKFLVHRSPASPSGSTDCLNSQRTINSDIPSLKSYETPNGTAKVVDNIEKDIEELSETNAECSDNICNGITEKCNQNLKNGDFKSNVSEGCYRVEEEGKEVFQEFWRREGFWKSSTSKVTSNKNGGSEFYDTKLLGEMEMKSFSNKLKSEIIKNVFEIARNSFTANNQKSENRQTISKTSSHPSSLCILQGKHQSGEKIDNIFKRNLHKTSKTSSEFSSKGSLMSTNCRRIFEESNRLSSTRNSSFSRQSRTAEISRTSRNIDSDILGSKKTIVKDVIVLPRFGRKSKDSGNNSISNNTEDSIKSEYSNNSSEIITNEQLISLLENLGKLGKSEEKSSCYSQKSSTENSNDNSSKTESRRTPLILRSQNSEFLSSFQKLRPILMENISRESEHYIYKEICSYLDTTCQRSSSSRSEYTTANETSQPSKRSFEEGSVSKESSLDSYPSIRSKYKTNSNNTNTVSNDDDELSKLLKKEEVVSLMLRYRKEQMENKTKEKNIKSEDEKNSNLKEEDNNVQKGKMQKEETKCIENKSGNIDEKLSNTQIETIFRSSEEKILQELEDEYKIKQHVDMLMDQYQIENENNISNVEKCFNVQKNYKMSEYSKNQNRKSVRFSETTEKINEFYNNQNFNHSGNYNNDERLGHHSDERLRSYSNRRFEQFADLKKILTISKYTETDADISEFNYLAKSKLPRYKNNQTKSEIPRYKGNESKSELSPFKDNNLKSRDNFNENSQRNFGNRGSNKSVQFSMNSQEINVTKYKPNSVDVSTSTPKLLNTTQISTTKEIPNSSKTKTSISNFIKKAVEKNNLFNKNGYVGTQTSKISNYYYQNMKVLNGLKKEIFPICDIQGTITSSTNENILDNRIMSRNERRLSESEGKPKGINLYKRDLDFKRRFEREFNISTMENKSNLDISKEIQIPKLELIPILQSTKKKTPSFHYNSGFSTSTTNYCGFDSTTDDHYEAKNPKAIFEKYRNRNFRSYSFISNTEEKTSIEDCDEYVLAVHNYTTTELLKKIGGVRRQSSKFIAERRSTVISFDENLRPIVSNEKRISKVKCNQRKYS